MSATRIDTHSVRATRLRYRIVRTADGVLMGGSLSLKTALRMLAVFTHDGRWASQFELLTRGAK